jgi:hypothetical protein
VRRGTVLVPMRQAALVAAVLSGTLAGAQTFRGAINGTVTDPASAAIPGAQVQIADDATGITRQTVSAAGGDFNFPDLPLGSYTVTVTTSAFDTLKITRVAAARPCTLLAAVSLSFWSDKTLLSGLHLRPQQKEFEWQLAVVSFSSA